MKRVRTVHEYHDADLLSASWPADDELILRFQLDREQVVISVRFVGIRNRVEVEDALRSMAEHALEVGSDRLGSCWGVFRDDDGAYLVAGLRIEARGLTE